MVRRKKTADPLTRKVKSDTTGKSLSAVSTRKEMSTISAVKCLLSNPAKSEHLQDEQQNADNEPIPVLHHSPRMLCNNDLPNHKNDDNCSALMSKQNGYSYHVSDVSPILDLDDMQSCCGQAVGKVDKTLEVANHVSSNGEEHDLSTILLTPESTPKKQLQRRRADVPTDHCYRMQNIEKQPLGSQKSKTTKKHAKKGKKGTEKQVEQRQPQGLLQSRSEGEKTQNNVKQLMTDYFPIRKSKRKTKADLKQETQKSIEDAILNEKQDGLKVVELPGKGRGVVTERFFSRGEFVVEYKGELIDTCIAKQREELYSQQPEKYGCYMYYFSYNNKTYCVDATAESGHLGRLVNHSRKSNNLSTKSVGVAGVPHLILIASRDINLGEELLYDYGDRSKESLLAHPWLSS